MTRKRRFKPVTALTAIDKAEVKRRRFTKRMLDNPIAELSKMVIETTGGGLPLIEFLWDVAQGKIPEATVRDRTEAVKQLLARGFGEAPKTIEVRGRIEHEHSGPDFSKMSDEELAQFRALARKANAEEAIEVVSVEDAEIVEDEIS